MQCRLLILLNIKNFVMVKNVMVILSFLILKNGYGQVIVKDSMPASFDWSLHIVDAPYFMDAVKTEAVRANDDVAPFTGKLKFQHYKNSYRNLSMMQSTDMARNLHGSLYYGHNVLWSKLVKPSTTKKYILNRVLANVTALGTDYLAIKLPYGYAFQHEEFHRAVMSTRHIYSYDEVWNFGKGLDIAVTGVKDEDLIYLKQKHPADLVRLASAGVEGEYRYLQRMREDNFFKQTNYPMIGISLLGTFHAVNYVNLPFAKRFNSITDSILAHDRDNVLARDFMGYDFSAWVYDLFRPNEPYEQRGNWPGGVGIKRPIKESDLTPEMKKFLRKTGNWQYLNFVSPFMIGINRLQLKEGYFFNFALRSVPTSFGYYAGGDFFLDFNNRQMMICIAVNKSKNLVLPSFDWSYHNFKKAANDRLSTSFQISTWLQPKDQMFAAQKSSFGFSIGAQPKLKISKNVSLIADFNYKTKGWVFSNPYLDDKFTGRFGFNVSTR